ncbi:hypothetical protein ACHAXR_002280 [Thalassiosira sp. AJA248-18]
MPLEKKEEDAASSSQSSVDSTKEPKRRQIKKFSERIADLKAYKEKHGHVNVKRKEDNSLADFCRNIRHARHNSGRMKLTENRIASLNSLGFDWSQKTRTQNPTKSFAERIEDLTSYQAKHSHLNVRKSEDKSLNGWCANVRQARKNQGKVGQMKLTEGRIASLNAIGFNWRVGDLKLEDKCGSESNNVSSISTQQTPKIEAGDGTHFKPAGGMESQARSDGATEHKMECGGTKASYAEPIIQSKLRAGDDLFPKVDTATKKAERGNYKSFSERVADLKAFKAKHGHVNVSSKIEQDRSLAQFCSIVRYARKNRGKAGVMRLSDDRIASLDAVGFIWKVREPHQTNHLKKE